MARTCLSSARSALSWSFSISRSSAAIVVDNAAGAGKYGRDGTMARLQSPQRFSPVIAFQWQVSSEAKRAASGESLHDDVEITSHLRVDALVDRHRLPQVLDVALRLRGRVRRAVEELVGGEAPARSRVVAHDAQ